MDSHIRPLVSINGIFTLLGSFPLMTYLVEFMKDFVISMMRTAPLPKHIALIMDGNRRYAKSKDMALKDGHSAGADSLIQVCLINYCEGEVILTIAAGFEYVLQVGNSTCYNLCIFY